MTSEEGLLWHSFLKNYPVKFYRQKVTGNYIADFYCHKAKLIVEIDGKHHSEKAKSEQDDFRTEYLSKLDIKVLRFTNSQVNGQLQYVCSQIDETVKNLLKS